MGNKQPKEKGSEPGIRELIHKHSIEPWHARTLIKEKLERQAYLARKSPLKDINVEEGLKYFSAHSAKTIRKEAFVKICEDLLNEHRVWTTPGDRDELHDVFESMDFDGSGQLDRGEWAGGLSVFFKGDMVQCVHGVFNALDGNGDKTLSKQELGEYLQPVVKAMIPKEAAALQPQLIQKATECVYNEMDVDKEGGVTADEMVDWTRRGNNLVNRLADIIDSEVYKIWLKSREEARAKGGGAGQSSSAAPPGGSQPPPSGPPPDQTLQGPGSGPAQSAWQQQGSGSWQQQQGFPGQSAGPGSWQQGFAGQSATASGRQQGPAGQPMPPSGWQQQPPPGQSAAMNSWQQQQQQQQQGLAVGQSAAAGGWQQGPAGPAMPLASWQRQPPPGQSSALGSQGPPTGQSVAAGGWQQGPAGQSMPLASWQQQPPPGQSTVLNSWQQQQGQSAAAGGWQQGPPGQTLPPGGWQQQAPPSQSTAFGGWPQQQPGPEGWQPQMSPDQSTQWGSSTQGYCQTQGPNSWQQQQQQAYCPPQGPPAWQQLPMGAMQQQAPPSDAKHPKFEHDFFQHCDWSCCGECGCGDEEEAPAGERRSRRPRSEKRAKAHRGQRPERDGTVWCGRGWGDSRPEGAEAAALAAEGRDWRSDLPDSYPWNVPPPPPMPRAAERLSSLDSQGAASSTGHKAGPASPGWASGVSTAAGESPSTMLSSAPYTPCHSLDDTLPASPESPERTERTERTGSPTFKSSGAYVPRYLSE